jgi:hypothetical protein
LLATVGDPVAQLQTPARMPELFAERGINATWVPLHVTPPHLPIVAAGAAASLCRIRQR